MVNHETPFCRQHKNLLNSVILNSKSNCMTWEIVDNTCKLLFRNATCKPMSLEDARIFSMLWKQTVYLRVTANEVMDVALDDQ